RANALKDDALVSFSRQLADLVIAPDVGQVHWADFGAFDQCIERGDEAATRIIPRIKALLSRERFLRFFRRGMRRRMAEQFLTNGERKLWVE
ncbi:MAG: hypothetical protein GWN48_23445, partial [Actinobacteria bacterium]|nr:hypothetical protein [Actinomycetota bacterium]